MKQSQSNITTIIQRNHSLPFRGGSRRGLLFFIISFFFCVQLHAGNILPVDSAVRHGVLDNGLTYYICPNKYPEGRAEFYLLQQVGSILEEENQRGLAHFLEHMAFNGTKNFPGKSLITYLENNGIRFGNDINAYTGFDETVYNISNVPITRTGIVDSCLLILHDWGGFITLDGREIDAERKVIHEEWRSKQGVRDRIYEQTLPKLFPDSNRYGRRMPIGLMSVVDNFPHKVLRDYYHKWYRPDLQAVVVAGDIDADDVEKRIKTIWSDTPMRKNPAKRPHITVADNATPIVAIGSDAELSGTTLRLSFKYDPQPREVSLTFEGKKDEYLRNMIVTMLNARMADLMATGSVRQGEGITFSDGDYSLARTKKALTAIVSLSDNSWQSGMKRIVYELKRTMEHGFSVAEYQRAVSQLSQWLASVERQQASGRGQMESNNMLVQKCMAHFLHGRPLLSNVGEAKIYRQLLQSVGIADINARFSQLVYGKGGLAILLQMPKKGDTTESDVLRIYGDAWAQTTVAHKIPDREPKPVLMPQKPQPGTITEEYHDKQYGTLELTLSNGARVVLKHNDTGRDEIRLSAVSNGGTSLMADADYNNFSAINTLPALGGLAHLSGPQLGRALEGSSATYQVSVTATSESFSGSCKAADAEHLLQLLYLRFTTVRKDTAAFERWKQSKRSSLQKSIANPMTLYGDTLRNLMYDKHPRNRSIALALADSVDYDRTCQLFLERFANAADFTFIFVGNVSADSLKPLICQYIASLPSAKGVKEQPNLAAMPELAKGSRKCRINVPMQAPRTSVVYNIMEKCRYNVRNNIACAVLNQVMDSRCTEQLRERLGGTYSISVTARISREPKEEVAMMFNFSTNPEQADTLLASALDLLRDIASNGITTEEFARAQNNLQKQHADYRKANAFWLSAISERVRHDSSDMLEYEKALKQVKPADVKKLARLLSKSTNTVEVIMDGI